MSPAVLWGLVGAGFIARLALSFASWGTTDTISFLHFAYRIDAVGLMATYRIDPLFNHPPLPGWWSWIAFVLARRSDAVFPIVFRLPVIAADLLSALLVRKVALARGATPRAALAMAAMYAWNPCAILISGYHGNTDAIYAMLSLLSLYLLADRSKPLLAGLALGAAINIKLIPVLLIPALTLTARSRRELFLLIAGLAVMAVPFLPPLMMEPAFARNVLAYRSQMDNWGIPALLALASGQPLPPTGPPPESHPATAYFRIGSWIVLAAVFAWAVFARLRGIEDRYRVAAGAYALFLLLTPGFGVQYLVLLAPLLYATSAKPTFANAYGLFAGLFLLAAYWYFWDGLLPMSSLFDKRFPQQVMILGLLVWTSLLYYLVIVAPRRAKPEAT